MSSPFPPSRSNVPRISRPSFPSFSVCLSIRPFFPMGDSLRVTSHSLFPQRERHSVLLMCVPVKRATTSHMDSFIKGTGRAGGGGEHHVLLFHSRGMDGWQERGICLAFNCREKAENRNPSSFILRFLLILSPFSSSPSHVLPSVVVPMCHLRGTEGARGWRGEDGTIRGTREEGDRVKHTVKEAEIKRERNERETQRERKRRSRYYARLLLLPLIAPSLLLPVTLTACQQFSLC